MNKWLNKMIPSAKVMRNSAGLRKFKKYLHHPSLWQFDRESFSRAVGVGLFVGAVPVLPFQTVLIVILCILVRANIPLAFLLSWISNPLTLIPIAYFTAYVGNLFLRDPDAITAIQSANIDFGSWHGFWSSIFDWLSQLGAPFFVGLPIVAISAGVFGYLIANFAWYCASLRKPKKDRK